MAFTAVILVKLFVTVGALLAPLVTLMGLPGMWLALAVAGLAEWLLPEALYSGTSIATCLGLAALGEAWEFSASSVRAKRAGAGKRGAIGALVGGIAGALVGTAILPLIGTLIGGGLGALAGSTALERGGGRSLSEALRIGRAAAAGQVLGVLGKLLIALVLSGWLIVATLV